MIKIASIGPTFSDELFAAGIATLPIAWGPDGEICYGELTEEQLATLTAVAAAHNPEAVPQGEGE